MAQYLYNDGGLLQEMRNLLGVTLGDLTNRYARITPTDSSTISFI